MHVSFPAEHFGLFRIVPLKVALKIRANYSNYLRFQNSSNNSRNFCTRVSELLFQRGGKMVGDELRGEAELLGERCEAVREGPETLGIWNAPTARSRRLVNKTMHYTKRFRRYTPDFQRT